MPTHEPRLDVEHALRAALGVPDLRVVRIVTFGAGPAARTAHVVTEHASFFAKWSLGGACDQAPREGAGLTCLARAGSRLVVPEVVLARARSAAATGLLVTPWLATRTATAEDQEQLGRGLAEIHRSTQAVFGWDGPSFCGGTPQDNTPDDLWPRFYAQRRLVPLVERVATARGLARAERQVYAALVERLPGHLGHQPAPSLVHGDLWAGNVLTSVHGPALVDPACTYADREFEFGISTLFGGFSARFWDAYQEAWPLPREWQTRNGLYQLYHLLNHHLLFGGGYGAEALALARRYL